MKSSHAKGALSLLKQKLQVDDIVRTWAAKCAITIHRFENVGNHLHLVVSFKVREGVQKFLRTISGCIARMITKAKKGHAFGQRFWDHLVFTRIVTGRRDFMSVMKYLGKNEVERDSGPGWRMAMEFREELLREAKRRRRSLEDVMRDRLEKFAAEIWSQTSDDRCVRL